MCGICGFVGDGDIDDLRRMNARLAHRGPDDDGFWTDAVNAVFLGHRRLSILDIEGGTQPMVAADGDSVIVFNGEIYNHGELRSELLAKGHRFTSDHSDTEVLLYGYREWGADLASHLNGMWAFAIYDIPNRTLFLSRDRFGKKPLFFTRQSGTFAFASELSALTEHPSVSTDLSILALQKYFAYGYIPAPHSIYQRIEKLPPGSNLTLDIAGGEHTVRKYWQFKLEPFDPIPADPIRTWSEELVTLIKSAVERRLQADVPVGIFLSGGIDSTSIAACAAELRDPGSIKTFAIGFDEPSFDESEYSKQAANHIGCDHHLEMFSLETAQGLAGEIASRLDEPMGDSSLLPTFLLCRNARKSVTVALGGDGADELFAGYDPFRALRAAELYDTLIPKPLHKGIRMLMARLPVSHANISLDFKIKATLRGLSYPKPLWSPVWLGPLEPDQLRDLFEAPADIESVYSEAIEMWDRSSHLNLIDQTLQFYTNMYLQNDILVKVDRASMMNSLEVRAPYLDIDLVNFVRRIPAEYKFRNGQTKFILKEALRGIVPEFIRNRSKKGFGIPIGRWFNQGGLRIDEEYAVQGTNTAFVRRSIVEHRRGVHDHRSFLWNHWILTNYLNPSSDESDVR